MVAAYVFYDINGYRLEATDDTEFLYLAVGVATGDMDVRKAADLFELWAIEPVNLIIHLDDIGD